MGERYDLVDTIRSLIDAKNTELYTNLPAIVREFDAKAQTVNVTVAVETPTVLSQNIPPARIDDIPVVFPQGSDWVMAGPLKKGDEVILVVSMYPIDEHLRGDRGKIQTHEDFRFHDLIDCYAIIGAPTYKNPTRSEKFMDRFHIVQGKNHIWMKDGEVEQHTDGSHTIKATGPITIECGNSTVELTPAGSVTVTAATSVTLDSPQTNITGVLNVDGIVNALAGVAATGTVAATVAVSAPSMVVGGTEMGAHTHGGVEVGTGSTLPA